jgi:hypothetical protein
MIKNILRSLFAPVVGSSDHEDRWVNLDDLGVWTYHTTKDTLGKKVHFHLTVTETDHPDTAADLYHVEFDASCNNQHKSGDVAINEEFTCEVDTNFWSDTKFTVTITSTKGSADAGVLLHVITDTNS